MIEAAAKYRDDAPGEQHFLQAPGRKALPSPPRLDTAGFYILAPERWIVLGADVNDVAPPVVSE